jgi:DNA-binding LacI/PurR family transcriptional regulator
LCYIDLTCVKRLKGLAVPITLKEIAEKADVSTSTVSFALRGKKAGKRRLSPETVLRVQAIANELGYRPNGLAKSLINSQTHTIGILLSSLSFGAEELLEGVKNVVAPEYSSLLAVYNSDGESERQRLDLFMQQRVDGVIAAFSGDPESISYYKDITEKYKIPVVLIDRGIDELDLPVVRSDHFASTYEGTCALQRLGHSRIQYISVSIARDLESTRLRTEGYRQAMLDSGLEGEIRETGKKDFKEWVRMDNLKHVARGILDVWMRDKSTTALFVDNDWLAYEIMHECRTYGIQIPEDLSLMGIGDYAFSGFSFVGLSTVTSQKQKPMGKSAAEYLLSRIDGDESPAGDIILPIEVKLRSTTKTISQGIS